MIDPPWTPVPPEDAQPSARTQHGHTEGADWEVTSLWWKGHFEDPVLVGLDRFRWIHGPWPVDLPARCIANAKAITDKVRVSQRAGLCQDTGCDGIVPIAVRLHGNLASLHPFNGMQRCTVCGHLSQPDPIGLHPSAHRRMRVARHLSKAVHNLT